MIDFTRRQRYALMVLLVAFWSGCGIIVWKRLSVPPVSLEGIQGAQVAQVRAVSDQRPGDARPRREDGREPGAAVEAGGTTGGSGNAAGEVGNMATGAGSEAQEGRAQGIAVHVCGAVRAPGVYRLPEDSRVDDCVKAAGGPLAKAALDAVNLAARVRDGQQVYIPFQPDPARLERAGLSSSPAAPAGPAGAGRVNINMCSVNELEGLPGIGPELARRILETRESRGGFQTVEDLLEVPGIGEKKLEAIRGLVSIQ
ncbi:MAG: ComEA family DNA-binding protein [Firmicutes bacterium]|nr:ComEA family DNA-binding protein [Bacillota bacterium]